MSAIEAHDLIKTFLRDVRALDGLGLSVSGGSLAAVLGPNGAGKSTAVKILTTLTRADFGTARVAGLDVRRDAAAVRRLIGIVQQKNTGDLAATGRENLTLQGRLYGLRGRALTTRVEELLERFGLAAAAHRVVRGYSGGMQRRLDVAMGLMHRPQVLFLDEPTTGLDPDARAELWKQIDVLRRQDGLTILLTTHYLEEADHLADRVTIVDHGRVVAEGTPDQLKGRMRGDAIHIELAEPARNGEIKRALGELDGVGEVVVSHRAVHARVDHGARAVPTVLSSLEGQGLRVASVTVARPSLDDVYFAATGRSLSEVGQ